jgi:hypothetical protein
MSKGRDEVRRLNVSILEYVYTAELRSELQVFKNTYMLLSIVCAE